MPDFTIKSNSSFYEGGCSIYKYQTEPIYDKCTITIIPYFRRLQSNKNYVRTPWTMRVYVTKTQGNSTVPVSSTTFNYLVKDSAQQSQPNAGYLPNNLAYPLVVEEGALYMAKDTWYQWGGPLDIKIPNDGGVYHLGIEMEEVKDLPKRCPAEGNAYLESIFTTSTYSIKYAPPAPVGLATSFNEDTRILNYVWTPADCSYIRLYRQFWDSTGNCIKEGYFPDASYKIYNDEMPNIKEYVNKDVAKVTWTMTNYNTGSIRCPDTPNETYSTSAEGPELILKTDCIVFVNDNGTYRRAVPWVNDNGNWKKASNTFVNDDSTWKRTIM